MNTATISLEAYNAFYAYKTAMEGNAVLLQDGRVCSVVPKDELIEELRLEQIKLRKEYDELFIKANKAMHDRDLYKSQIDEAPKRAGTLALSIVCSFIGGYLVHILISLI